MKIIVKGVFLLVDDDEVLKMFNKFNFSFNSDFKYEKIWYLEIYKWWVFWMEIGLFMWKF